MKNKLKKIKSLTLNLEIKYDLKIKKKIILERRIIVYD